MPSQITLALLFSGALAAAPQSGPVIATTTPGTTTLYNFSGGKADFSTVGANKLTTNKPIEKVEGTTTTTVGLYGCIMSGHIGLPAQHLKYDTSTVKVEKYTNTSGVTTARSFYGVKASDNGKAIELNTTTTPSADTLPQPGGWTSAVTDPLDAMVESFNREVVECCKAGVDLNTAET